MRLKIAAIAFFISLVVGFAALTPWSLHINLPNQIPLIARAICPETGQFAPQLPQARRATGPETWVACLDAKGQRIEDKWVHFGVVNGLGAIWTALTFMMVWSVARLVSEL